MVRYHLNALARDHDDHDGPQEPIINIIERRVAGDRNTSNVYVLRVPWTDPVTVRMELDELKHIPRAVLEGVGTGCTQGRDDALHPLGTTGCTQNRSLPGSHRVTPPNPPRQRHGFCALYPLRAPTLCDGRPHTWP